MNKNISIYEQPFYVGIVEDRNDPLELGRVRVRVFGVHTESTTELPTEDLPWSIVTMSGNNPGKSGVGWSPNGLVLGSKVTGYFQDGNSFQHFVVLGSFLGINDFVSTESSTSTSTVENEDATGEISMKNEIDIRLPSTIDIINDVTYYGIYALASNESLIKDYIKSSSFVGTRFNGTTTGTPQFNAIWTALAIENANGFKADQHEFIKRTFYLPFLNAHKHIGLHTRSRGVLECVWSTSVQYGGYNNKIARALAGKDISILTDSDVVTLIQNDKLKNVEYDFKGYSDTKIKSIKDRIVSEKVEFIALCNDSVTAGLIASPDPTVDQYGEQVISYLLPIVQKSVGVPDSKGFKDPSGHYPTKNYTNDPDTNHQARNKNLKGTAADAKKKSVLKGAGEPDSPYNAKYPFNKVYQSESGHVVEIDDTDGAERIHVYHRSGTFIEFHPDGTIVRKSSKDDTEIVLANKSVYVVGTCNITVEGNTTVKCFESIDIQASNNISMKAGGNITMLAGGDMTLGASRTNNLLAGTEIIQDAPKLSQNGAGIGAVKVDIGEKVKATIALSEETDAGEDDVDQTGISPEESLRDFKSNTGFDVLTDQSNSTSTRDEPLVEKNITISITRGQHQATVHNGTTEGLVSGQTITVKGLPKGAKIYEVINLTSFNVDKDAEIDIIEQVADLGPPVAKQNEVLISETTGPYTLEYKLSDHYTIRDLTQTPVSPTKLKAQSGISVDKIVQNMKAVAINILEPVRLLLGNKFVITNGLRDSVGTSNPSDHHFGSAVDLQFPGVSDIEVVHIAKKIRDILPKFHQIIIEYHGRAPVIHIAYRLSGHPRGINSNATFTAYAKPFQKMARGMFDKNHNLVYT